VRKVGLIVAMVLVFSLAHSKPPDPGGYQGAKWGMSPKEVKSAFPGKKWKGKAKRGYTYYYDKLIKIKVAVGFYFDAKEKRLWKVGITPMPMMGVTVSGSPYGPLYTYKQLKVAMRKKYGEPKRSDCVNRSGTVDLDAAIVAGQARCFDEWELGETLIVLQAQMRYGPFGGMMWDEMIKYEMKNKITEDAPNVEDKI